MDIIYSLSLLLHEQYIPALAVGLLAFFLAMRGRKDFRYRALLLIVALSISISLTLLTKTYYQVERPCQGVPGKVDCPETYGFPSAHSSSAIVFPLVAFGDPSFAFFYFMSIVVAGSRIYLGVHTIDQVVGGLCIGIVSYFISVYILGRIKHYFKGVLVEG
jgi:hypothetical protein